MGNSYLPDNRTIQAAYPASLAVAVGDLMYWDSGAGLARPASQQSDQGTLALNQRVFAKAFLGISQDQRLVTETTSQDRVVIQDGVFDFDCDSTDWAVGDLIGACENAGGTALLTTKVARVTNPALAIGVCVSDSGGAVTRVRGYFSGRIAWAFLAKSSTWFGGQGNTSRTTTLTGTLTLTVADAPVQVLDPGGAGRTVVLPDESASAGLEFRVHNAADAAEVLTIKASDGTTTVCTPTQNESAYLYCDGTTWRGLVGANN